MSVRTSAPTRRSARTSSGTRPGIQTVVGCVAFLCAYATLQLCHATGHDPAIVRALHPIPLFARFVASAACAVPLGIVGGALVTARPRARRRLPTLLAAAIALFIGCVLLLP